MGRYSLGFIAQRLGIFVLTVWIAASVIWLAPKPSRVVEPGTGGH